MEIFFKNSKVPGMFKVYFVMDYNMNRAQIKGRGLTRLVLTDWSKTAQAQSGVHVC